MKKALLVFLGISILIGAYYSDPKENSHKKILAFPLTESSKENAFANKESTHEQSYLNPKGNDSVFLKLNNENTSLGERIALFEKLKLSDQARMKRIVEDLEQLNQNVDQIEKMHDERLTSYGVK